MSADPLIGTTVGGCEILEVIGQGGMGVIYKGRQKSLDRIVALKVLSPHLANDSQFVARFQKEARAIARINHPNILAVYDVGDDQNINYMLMELIDGESLAELQTAYRGPLVWHEAVNYVRQGAQGLEAAQASGIIHRDIKPENLMVTRKGVIKVSDFGLAKDSESAVHNTSVDTVMGTPAFMSPEQCDGKKVDARSDIYSLGGTFYRLVTGRLPFEAETAMSMMYRHKHEALIPPHEIVPELPVPISDVICKMMAKKREQRYQSMTEVIDALDHSVQLAGDMEQGGDGGGMPYSGTGYSGTPLEPSGGVAGSQGPFSRPSAGNTGVLRRATQVNTSRITAVVPPAGYAASDSSRLNLQSGVLGISAPGMSVSDDGYANVTRGDDMAARGDLLGAVKLYFQALQSNTLDNATRQRVQYEISKEVYKRRQAAESLVKRGLLVEAGRECRVLSEIDPTDDFPRTMLKDIEHRLSLKRTLVNDVKSAISANQFEKAIKIWDGTPPELRDEALSKQVEQLRVIVVPSAKLAEQGESFSRQGRLEEAIAAFEDALKINPTCEPARLGLKECELKVQQIEQMLKEGYQHSLDQNYQKAIDTWKPILSIRPGHPQAVKSIVDAYMANAQNLRNVGDLEGALANYSAAKDIDSQNRAVTRYYEDIQKLYEKERALIERAQEAEGRRRWNEAIHFWKDVQGVNPANKHAAQRVGVLSKKRSGSLAFTFTMVFAIVAGGACSYQYWQEKQVIDQALKQMSQQHFQESHEILSFGTFLIFKDRANTLKLESKDWTMIQDARDLESKRNLQEASFLYKDVAKRVATRNPGLFRDMTRDSIRCESQYLFEAGTKALDTEQWTEAAKNFRALADGVKNENIAETEIVAKADFSNLVVAFVEKLVEGQNFSKENKLEEAHAALNDALEKAVQMKSEKCQAAVRRALVDLQYDPKRYNESFTAGRKALESDPPDWKSAQMKFQDAHAANRMDKDAESYRRFSADGDFCARLGMVLIAPHSLLNRKLDRIVWTNDEHNESFCIDRYEFPNEAGKMPLQGVPYLEAKDKCEMASKKLCTRFQWQDACRGNDFTRQYPYGDGKTENSEICNTGTHAPVASGSRKGCRNTVGVYDMSGNLAEWTLEAGGTTSDVLGGSYLTPAKRSNCGIDIEHLPHSGSQPNLGFRCCRALPKSDDKQR